MNEIICTNDVFAAEILAFYKEHGVTIPFKNKIYSIKEMKRHTTGDIGVILNEIDNPKVPIKHPVMGTIMMDVTFNINRFSTLLGMPLKKEEIEDILVNT